MNNSIFYFLYNFSHQTVLVDKLIFFVADTLPYVVILTAFIFLFTHHEEKNPLERMMLFSKTRWKEVVLTFFASGLAWVVARLLKSLIHAPRPFVKFLEVRSIFLETGYAFPSGHATFFMALAISIYLIHRKIGYWFIAAAVAIGVARVMAGVHFPVDILGGFLVGGLVACGVRQLLNKFAYLSGNV